MKIQGLMYSPIVKPQVFTSDVDKDIDKIRENGVGVNNEWFSN